MRLPSPPRLRSCRRHALLERTDAHDQHEAFSAGEPGRSGKARAHRQGRDARVSADGEEDVVRPEHHRRCKGEQIRFVLENAGGDDHEFVLATVAENRKHGELMKKFPDMEHDDPNAKRIAHAASGEIVWKFTKAGEFEYACLIPGHYEAGMHGKIVVK